MTIEEIENIVKLSRLWDNDESWDAVAKLEAHYMEYIDWLIRCVRELEILKADREKQIEKLDNTICMALVRIKSLEVDLSLNASMLAKQTDLAREAETGEAFALQRVTELTEGIKKHKKIMEDNENQIKPVDRELYRLVEGK